ncbi:MAG: DMT family protein, partial [Flavobacteriales bacterium]|nr:DMT family protein [Flavobacteriales bacterium]
AFFEYCLQVPANRLGYVDEGGPFSLVQLKVIQEVITLVIFVVFSLAVFKQETFRWNHALAAVLLVIAVWLVFKKEGQDRFQRIPMKPRIPCNGA